MAEIVSIAYKPKSAENKPPDHFSRTPVDQVQLVAGYGIEGDRKGGHPRRQLNLLGHDMVQQLAAEGYRTEPGALGEQIVIAGMDVDALAEGAQLAIGDTARIEITGEREPCDRFEAIQSKTIAESEGRIGVMARVLAGGTIHVGDVVKVIAPETAGD